MTTQGRGPRARQNYVNYKPKKYLFMSVLYNIRETIIAILSIQAIQTLNNNPRNFERDGVSYIDMVISKCKELCKLKV